MTTGTKPEAPLWMVREASGMVGGWWVTEGEWEPGHPERVKGRYSSMEDALQAARDHNARLGRNGRPAVPLSADTVRAAMARCQWNVSDAARMLGVGRATLHRWLKARMANVSQNPPVNTQSGRKSPNKRSKK